MKPGRAHLLTRICLAAAIAVLAALVRFGQASPPDATLEGVARMLGAATGAQVGVQDFVWEPSRGAVADLLLGRRVLFLARPASSPGRELFRASVRVTPEGYPLNVVRAVNLTSSPLGDVQSLVARGYQAAYAMNAYGGVQQITLLELSGGNVASEKWLDRLLAQLTNWQQTGTLQGVGRTEISTAQPCTSVHLAFEPGVLTITPGGSRERIAVDIATGEVVPGAAADRVGATSMQVPHLAKPPIIWAVDTVRAWTGPEPIAWLEEKVFDLKDRYKRLAYFGFGGQRHEPLVAAEAPAPAPPPPPRQLGADGMPADAPWPPPPLQSMWKEPDPQEGKWEPVRHGFLKRLKVRGAKQSAPPYFYTTYVRSDPKRPYSKVLLIAIDSRQLQLGMEGGVEDPKPLTGVQGEGRIPRDPPTLSRVVGAFNGAFKTTHGQYGMMVNRRVLLPPKPGGATVLVRDDDRAAFGTWPASDTIPPDVVSFRQNLEPLVEDGKVNPSGRTQWGFQLPGTSMLTHRSGLCVTSAGHMVYAWGAEVSAITLGNAMVQAGCVYGVHLDMNPHHTAFSFIDIRDVARKDYDARILTPEMETLPERYIVWSPKDFFYLMLRKLEPAADIKLEADEGTQPPPAWAPAFFRASSVENGIQVRLTAIAPGRARFRIRGGTQASDDDPSDDLSTTLDAAEARQVLAAVGLGNAAKGSPLGIRVGSTLGAPLGEASLLLAGEQGELELLPPEPSRSVPDHRDAIELPSLRVAGKLTAAASVRSAMRKRAAMCVARDRYLWVAETTASIDEPLVDALGRIGCEHVASLDRGAHATAFVARAGTATPPVDRYEQPVLYVLSDPMRPGAARWGAPAAAASPIPVQ